MGKKKNDKKVKGKKAVKVVGMILVLCLFATPVMAVDLNWSSDYDMKDNINVIAGSEDMNGSAGVFVGTVAEVRLESGKKLLGLGGASLHIGDTGNLLTTIVPITLFDDMIQLGVSADLSNFQWIDPDDYLFSVGFSASDLVNKLWK